MIARMWPFAEPYIKRALDHSAGELAADDIKWSCMQRDTQLWLVACGDKIVGAATTEIVKYPQRKHAVVLTIAGSHFTEWVADMDTLLCEWARAHECDALEAHVRRGLAPKLAPLDYKHLHSIVIKKLDTMPAAIDAGEGHG